MSTYTSEPGTRLAGRYLLVDQTATGNGWIMWKAQDETLARAVSVLTFAPGFPRIREVITAARAASRLTDPRLAQVFDVEDGGDQAYIVLEWVAGDSLADLLADGPMDSGRACALVIEAARALAGAHAAGQAHLLLGPGSLRWTRSSGVKITGLGIDAALAGAGLANASDPALTDTRDLAGLLYAALTGYWPCESQTTLPAAPMSDGEVCTPRQVSPDVPTAIDAVITRALLQRQMRQGAPILSPSALADEIAGVAPPVPLPEPAPISRPFEGYDGYGDRGSQQGYGQGGYGPQGGYGGQGGYSGYGPRQSGGFAPGNPSDPATWSTNSNGTSAYQQGYAGRRGGTSRTMITVVVVLVLAAVVAGAWELSANLNKSSGSNHAAGNGPSGQPSGSSSAASATVLKPQSAKSFNILGSSPSQEDTQDVDNPLTGKAPAWQTQQYASADFGQLKNGDGYLIQMSSAIKLSSVEADFASGSAMARICVGNSNTTTTTGKDMSTPCPAGFTQAAPEQAISGAHTFTINSSVATGSDILIWFTQMPSSGQESISKVVVSGTTANG
jgi:hypothetical protein